jgi:hypothetical protein
MMASSRAVSDWAFYEEIKDAGRASWAAPQLYQIAPIIDTGNRKMEVGLDFSGS